MNKAVFLDRDGTLNIDPGYVHKIEDFELYPNAVKALRLLKGFDLFIITNQSGIGRGYFTEEEFHKFNDHLIAQLKKEGIEIKETFYCPHHPDEKCDCRKPNTRFVDEAAKKYDLDLDRSFIIGDHPHDIEMGHKAGLKAVYMLTGHGEKHKKELKHKPDLITGDILEAAGWIIMADTKLKTKQEIKGIVEKLKKQGKTIVTTNGVFDILHVGHIKTFEEAKRQGDILIVGLNSDASTKRLKGPERPINSENDRAEMLAALDLIDYIVIFEEDNPIKLLETIKPDVHVKYEDYGKGMIEAETVEKNGGRIHLAKKIKGYSTTDIIKSMK